MFSSSTRSSVLVTALLALAANACSARDARPALALSVPVECAGGTIQTDDDAARYATCESIVGDLRITHSELTDLGAFSNVRSVTGNVVVDGNAKLISWAGLKGLKRAHGVEIANNPLVCGYFGVLPALEHVDAPLVLRQNRGLSSREVREALERIEVKSEGVDEVRRQASL
jgi:hypothetical protein